MLAPSNGSLRSLRCSPGCHARSARGGWRSVAAAFLARSQPAANAEARLSTEAGCSRVRPGQRRASLAQHGGARSGHGSASHDRTRPRSSVGQVRTRSCSRAGCRRPATSTLTYAYRDSTAVLGPLASQAEPHCYDLCQQHAQTLSAPRGWEVIRLAVESQPKPTTDDLLALADAVRDVGLSYDPPAGSTSETPLRRTGLVELARRGHLTVLADPGTG